MLADWMRPNTVGTTVILLKLRPGIFDYDRPGFVADAVLLTKSGELHGGNKGRDLQDSGYAKMDHSLRGFLEMIFLHGEPLGGKENVVMTLFGVPIKRFNWSADLKQPPEAGDSIEWTHNG
jgi:hypothetical protein